MRLFLFPFRNACLPRPFAIVQESRKLWQRHLQEGLNKGEPHGGELTNKQNWEPQCCWLDLKLLSWGFLKLGYLIEIHGSLNVPIFHITQPLGIWSINVYNGYYKVMSNIPKMGHLPIPDRTGNRMGVS